MENTGYCILEQSSINHFFKEKVQHLVHFNLTTYVCHCQNILSCIFQDVMQMTYFPIGVQKYDTRYFPASSACL